MFPARLVSRASTSHAAQVDADWNRRAPLSLGARLGMYAEIFGALAFVVIGVGLAARASDAVASLLFG